MQGAGAAAWAGPAQACCGRVLHRRIARAHRRLCVLRCRGQAGGGHEAGWRAGSEAGWRAGNGGQAGWWNSCPWRASLLHEVALSDPTPQPRRVWHVGGLQRRRRQALRPGRRGRGGVALHCHAIVPAQPCRGARSMAATTSSVRIWHAPPTLGEPRRHSQPRSSHRPTAWGAA